MNIEQSTLAVLFHKGKLPIAAFDSFTAAYSKLKNEYDLFIFDLDRTWVPFDSDELYPEMTKFIEALPSKKRPQFAIASNRGGTIWWELTQNPMYLSYEKDQDKLSRIARKIGVDPCRVYTAYGYYIDGKWTIPKALKPDELGSRFFDRKPRPGMLLQAMADCGVPAGKTLMIGDADTDVRAAKNAECDALLVKMEKYLG